MTFPENAALRIDRLSMAVPAGRQQRTLLRDVTLDVARGAALGLVGESGSGKSLTARSILGLLPERASVSGEIWVGDAPVLQLPRARLRELRARKVAMVYQDPRAAMNPMRTIGDFLTEGMDASRSERLERSVAALRDVGIHDGARRFRQYPHQLSGGLLQRVVIAAALLPGPDLIVADEPTTALDVTSQSEVMALLNEQQERRGLAMVFISHDLDLAAAVTDSIAVMYAGTVVETGPSATMHSAALHPYTTALMASRPSTREVRPLRTVPGRPVSAHEAAEGCAFASRCPHVLPECRVSRPAPIAIGDHLVACIRAGELRSLEAARQRLASP